MLVRLRGSSPNSGIVIGSRVGNMYLLKARPVCALVHESDSDSLCELWHRRNVQFDESRSFGKSHEPIPTVEENEEQEALKVEERPAPASTGT